MKRLSAVLAAVIAVALAGCGGSAAPTQSATGSVHPAGWGGTPKGILLPRPLLQVTQTGVMYDAVTLSEIPANPFAAAGYTSGLYTTWSALLAEFPRAHHVSIAINTSHHADCLDVEPGDASPSQAGAWARADMAAGFKHPCLYSDLAEMPAVKASLAAAGLSRSQYFLWLAWYRYTPGLVTGYDAVQYSDRCLGRNLDCSTVTLQFLSIAQPPYVPAPVPVPTPHPAPQPLPVCIHKRESAAACTAAKAKIASDQRAAASSNRALAATNKALSRNKCAKPYRRGVCVHKGHDAGVFQSRVRFFKAAAVRLEAAN